MLGVEAIDESRHAVDDRLRAGHPDDAGRIMRGIAHMPLQPLDRRLHMLGIGEQCLAEGGEPVAGRVPRHELVAKPPLKLAQPPVHG
jgi:hypothetical protein